MEARKASILISRIVLALFLIIAILELLSHIIDNRALHIFTKPLLMPLLSVLSISLISVKRNKMLIVPLMGGLFFSWLGDSFLLYQDNTQQFFIMGLSAFLIAHILYIILYFRAADQPLDEDQKTSNISSWLFSVVLVSYYVFLVIILWDDLGDMIIQVILYGLVLTAMGIAAVWRKNYTNVKSYLVVLTGALLFIISDTILAFNKFLPEVTINGFWIMLTYILAQLAIVYGIISHERT